MRTDQLEYDLPEDRIATAPAEPRDAARLMVVHRGGSGPCRGADATGAERIEHRLVRDLPRLGLLRAGDLVVVNRTRVLPASFEATRTATGGRVGGLYLSHSHANEGRALWRVMLESRGTLRPGERLGLGNGSELRLLASLGRGQWEVQLESDLPTPALLERIGRPPLPPYIRRARRRRGRLPVEVEDSQRYNTVYAAEAGSVAAPTAGLHLTSGLLAELDALGVQRAEVVLQIGLGTFEPVRVETLGDHAIHEEHLHVPAETIAALARTREAGGRIVPIGTTTVRALESLPASLDSVRHGYDAATRLFIHPDAPFTFRFTDSLLTNFHLPRSTLLAMVATLPGVGLERLLGWYREAIDQGYRFYSYGDAMLIV